MRPVFENTEERCKVCGGKIQEVSETTSNFYVTGDEQDGFSYELRAAIGHRCSDCGIQYLILEEK